MPDASPTDLSLPSLAGVADGAYVGHGWRDGTMLRSPSGESTLYRSTAALAAAVLAARLGRNPGAPLVEAFAAEWVERRGRGDFVWPLPSIDEWLSAQAPVAPRSRSRHGARRRPVGAALLDPLRRVGAFRPVLPSPRGGC